MKKILIAICSVGFAIFSACGGGNIGIIGGADGPTSILVSENRETIKGQFGEQYEKKPVRMFKAKGELYYDCGLVSDATARCGTLDGNLTKSVAENEIPQNDGESNFDAEGYQSVTSITKEVPIDGKWVIFKKYDTYGTSVDGLKYCHYIKGHLNNAVVDSELIVLSESENVTFNDVYEPLLSSQFEAGADAGKIIHNPIVNDKWGISLSSKDVSNRGLTLLVEQFGGKPSGDLQTGEWFSLEVCKDDKWQPCETNPLIDYAWNSVAYKIEKNEITELSVEWEWLYGELSPGYYRLSKEIMDFRETGDYDKEIYQLYFSVE